MPTQLFLQHEAAIRSLGGDRIDDRLLLARDGRLSAWYAPFDWMNAHARLVLVGITPGRTQMFSALRAARQELLAGASAVEAQRAGLTTGAFSGALRGNLIALLDRIGLHAWLRLRTCGELFGTAAHLLHSCSTLPFPVLVDGRDYNGIPGPMRHPMLRDQVERHFVPMVRTLAHAVFIPLGRVPTEVLRALATRKLVDERRILDGLPHPSGANAERISYFLGTKERSRLSVKTGPDRLDIARTDLVRKVAALAPIA